MSSNPKQRRSSPNLTPPLLPSIPDDPLAMCTASVALVQARSTSTAPKPLGGAHKFRQLTVQELERYIRPGCQCLVCELASTEIRALQVKPEPTARRARAGIGD